MGNASQDWTKHSLFVDVEGLTGVRKCHYSNAIPVRLGKSTHDFIQVLSLFYVSQGDVPCCTANVISMISIFLPHTSIIFSQPKAFEISKSLRFDFDQTLSTRPASQGKIRVGRFKRISIHDPFSGWPGMWEFLRTRQTWGRKEDGMVDLGQSHIQLSSSGSNEKNPGCLGYIMYIGDYTTQLYGDYSKPL